MNKNYTSTAKPKVGGAISVAPSGTALPTDASTALADTYKGLGYVSSDGVQVDEAKEYTNTTAWGGDVVDSSITSHTVTFKFTLIEVLNIDVLKSVFGDSNVTGDLSAGITVKSNATEMSAHPWIIDKVMKNGTVERDVIPSGKVTAIDTITYSDGALAGFAITVTALADDDGNAYTKYIKAAGASS